MSAINPHDPDQFFSSVDRKRRFSLLTVVATVAVYQLAGLCALAVSFSLHSRVMAEMLGDTGFVPYAIAASLEGFKLGTIVVYGYLHRKTLARPEAGWLERIKPWFYVGLIRFFQLMVLSLSLLCTMAVIAKMWLSRN